MRNKKNRITRTIIAAILAVTLTVSAAYPGNIPSRAIEISADTAAESLDDMLLEETTVEDSDASDSETPAAEQSDTAVSEKPALEESETAVSEESTEGNDITETESESGNTTENNRDAAENSESDDVQDDTADEQDSKSSVEPETAFEPDTEVSEKAEDDESETAEDTVSFADKEIETECVNETDALAETASETQSAAQAADDEETVQMNALPLSEEEDEYNFIQYLMTEGGCLNIYYADGTAEVLVPEDFTGDYDVEVNMPVSEEVSYTAFAYDGYVVDTVLITDESGNELSSYDGNGGSQLSFSAMAKSDYKVIVSVSFKESEMPEGGQVIRFVGTGTGSIKIYSDEYMEDLIATLDETGEEYDVSGLGTTFYLSVTGDEDSGTTPYDVVMYKDAEEVSSEYIYSSVNADFNVDVTVSFDGDGYEAAEIGLRTISEIGGIPELLGDGTYYTYYKNLIANNLENDITKMTSNPEVNDVYATRATVISHFSPTNWFSSQAPLYVSLILTPESQQQNSNYVYDLLGKRTYKLYECASTRHQYCPKYGQTGYLYFIVTDVDATTGEVSLELFFLNDNGTLYQHAHKGYESYTLPTGSLQIIKSWEKNSKMVTIDTDIYSLKTTFTIYSDKACKTVVTTVTTDAETGKATVDGLDAGTYYIKETSSPDLALDDDTVDTITIKTGETATYKKTNTPGKVRLSLKKVSSEDEKYYSTMKGAVYGVFASKKEAQDATEDDYKDTCVASIEITGATTVCDEYFLIGKTYYVKEVVVPDSGEWALSSKVYSFKVTSADAVEVIKDDGKEYIDVSVTVTEKEPKYVKIRILKKTIKGVTEDVDYDSDYVGYENWLKDIPQYTLKGAQITFWWDKEDAEKGNEDTAIGTVTVKAADDNGDYYSTWLYLDTTEIALGETKTIYFKETSPSIFGYALNNTVYNKTVDYDEEKSENGAVALEYEFSLTNYPSYVILENYVKKVGTGGEPVEGAIIKVTYYPYAYGSTDIYTWYFKTGENGRILTDLDENGNPQVLNNSTYSSDYIYYSKSEGNEGVAYFPMGFYTIQEVYAPDPYVLDDTVYYGQTEEFTNATETTRRLRLRDVENDVIGVTLTNEEYIPFEFMKVDEAAHEALAGAEYRVYYYKGATTTAEAAAMGSATKTWRFKSDSDGYVIYDADHKISGGSLYTDDNGDYGVPFGLMVVVEVVAPPNHEVNNDYYLSAFDLYAAMVIKVDSKNGARFYYKSSCGETSKGVVYHEDPGPGYVTLVKSSSNTSITNGNTGYSLIGAEYTVYTDSACTTVAKNTEGSNAVLTVKDENGTTNTLSMAAGTYYVKETKTPAGFIQDTEVYPVELKSTNTESNPYKLKVSDVPVTYTAKLVLEKTTKDNTKLSMAGAIFQLDFYAGTTSASGTAARTWYLTSKDAGEGIADVLLSEDYLASGYSNDSFYTKSDNSICLPIGYLVITEIQAPEGFVKSDETVTYTFTTSGWSIVNSTGGSVSGSTATIPNEMVQKAGYIDNTEIAGGLSVQKIDYMLGSSNAHGDTDLSGAEFTIVNATGRTVDNKDETEIPTSGLSGTNVTYADVLAAAATSTMQVITTDAGGFATTDMDGDEVDGSLPFGTYYVIETKAATGYLLNDTWVGRIVVDENGNRAVYPAQTIQDSKSGQETVTQQIYLGGLSVQKIDALNGTNTPTGSLSLEGAELTIVNASANAAENASGTVIPTSGLSGSVTYEQVLAAAETSTMQVITTDDSGYAATGSGDLPYGTYYVIETKAPDGYEVNTTWVGKVEVDKNGIINAAETDVEDMPTRGGLSVQKIDYMLGSNAKHGDTDLSDAVFTIVNASARTTTNAAGNKVATTGLTDETATYAKIKEYVDSSSGDTTYIMQTITTDESGFATTDTDGDGEDYSLPYGTYYVIETQAAAGYLLNETWVGRIDVSKKGVVYAAQTIQDSESGQETTAQQIYLGGLSVQKIDYMLDRNADHGDTDLSGAEFTIINASDAVAVNKDGDEIPTSGLSGASVTYADAKVSIESGSVMQVITTKKDGSATTGTKDLPFGTYYVIETKAATGYFLNESWVGRIEVRKNGVVYAAETIQDEDSGDETTAQRIYRSGISLVKVDLEMQEGIEQGEAYFAGAEFTIINASDALVENADGVEIPSAKSKISSSPDYVELRALADDGSYTVQVITTDENGLAATGINDLPYGTYYVIETKSSYGYWIDEDFIGLAVVREDSLNLALGTYSDSGDSYFIDINDTSSNLASTVDQQVRRKNLSFIKVDIDGNYKSYIPFLITAIAFDDQGNEVELESHVIVSNAYGYVDTSRTHSANTNGFDQYVVDGKVTAEGEALLKEASAWGVWFQGNGKMDTADMTVTDSYGALYTCYYRITELQCEDNSDLSENLLNSDLIYLYNDTGDLTELLSNNAQMYVYHPLVDTEIVLTSAASDVQSGTQVVSANESVEVNDEVSYTHVSSDHTYRMETQFVDIMAGNKVLTILGTNDGDAAVSDDGLWVTKEFQPEKKSGTNNTYGDITMSALLNTSGLYGHTIVAVDYLYQYVNIDSTTGYWVLVAKHEDYTDDDQMLYVPDIHTNAVDGLTESRVGAADEGDYIVDTVTYTNLASKTNYVLLMYVADAETGEAVVTNADGSPFTVKARIMSNSTAAMISGTKTMPYYYIDSSEYSGRTLVAVETLYLADEDDQPYGDPVVESTSIIDEDETIRYPVVHTSASDSLTADDVGTSSETAIVYDEVTIENVVFDDNDLDGQYTYTVTGTLVYQQDFTDADGVSHTAGEEVETLDGTLDTVTITSDASGNATFMYADGTTAKGSVKITAYGQNAAKTIGGDAADNSYAVDSTAAIATVTVELAYVVDSSKLEGGTVVVFEDLYHNDAKVAGHADITDESQSVHYPEVKTSAADDSTLDDVGTTQENAMITDTVTLTNLVPGRTYTVSGKLVNQSDGSDVIVDGQTVTQTAEITVGEGTITAANGEQTTVTAYDETYHTVSGTVDLTFTFDATSLAGETVVVFEDLVHNDVVVASHADITDEGQTIHFPEVHTTAADDATGDDVGALREEATITDTVILKNLVPGHTYTVSGKLVDQETGEDFLVNGETVTRSAVITVGEGTITAEGGEVTEVTAYDEEHNSVDGKIELVFAFDASALADQTIVVFEDLEHNGMTVATHADITDESQTVHYPEVKTSAVDDSTTDDVGAIREEATVTDTVILKNLVPGRTYTVSGKLVDQETGEDFLVNGEAVTQTAEITVTEDGEIVAANGEVTQVTEYDEEHNSVDGTVQLVFIFDAGALAGETVVVFEDLVHNNVTVASHADITDESQTVHFPEVKTSVADDVTIDDVGAIRAEASITDTVILSNLVPGREYTVKGRLVNQEDGSDFLVNDEAVTQETTITVTEDGKIVASNGEVTTVTEYDVDHNSVSGTVELVFTFDASSLEGETAVVFEDLYHNNVRVAWHNDLKDEGQTVHFPEIHTTAADGYTEDSVATVSGEAVIVDTVIYSNLIPGREYTVSGVLMNKETGETILDAEGNAVTAERTFTAGVVEDGITAEVDEEMNSVSGTIDITFTFDGSLLEDTTAVAFEDLVHNGITVTTHSDITDEDETVHFPKIRTSAIDGNVGDEAGVTGKTRIVDTVSLWNLETGMTYTVNGVLMNKNTGEKLLVNGETVAQSMTITVNAGGTVTAENGGTVGNVVYDANMNSVDCTVDLVYTLDASALAGATTVVFEDLVHNGVTVASHAVITDLGQTIHFPEIHTTATDLNTSGHVGTVKGTAVVQDLVYFTNLVVGKEYTLTGTLMNRKTGLPFLDEAGAEITASVTFTAGTESSGNYTVSAYHEDNNSVDGTYLMTFTLDSSLLEGKTVVAFEYLYHNDVEVTTHTDLGDDEQSVHYPDIHTTAVDYNTGDHVGTIWGALINFARSLFGQETEEDAKQVITDTVALSNLVPGKTYVVSGKLYNATESLATGEDTPLVIDGEEIAQAVTITVSEDGKSITAADGSATSVTAYNEELNSVDGTVDLVYTLDSSKIQGIEVVVFEKLYQDATYTPETNPEEVPEEDLVNEHSDIEDESQSVSEVSIHTTAVDTTTGDHVGSVPDGTDITSIRDEVNLAGLVSGMEYTIDGVLVSLGDSDLSAGKIYYLKTDGTLTESREEAYTETLTFTAEEASETYYLNFAINSDKVQGKSLTVFENIYHNDTLISSHPAGDGDGWDEESLAEQTVVYPAGKTNATDTATDEHLSLADTNRTIVDRVYFENLLVGQEYTVTGQLVYKEAFTDANGVSHKAGEAVTESVAVSFTASEDLTAALYEDGSEAAVDSLNATTLADGQTVISGYVSISFTVNASRLAGATLVAFETFRHDGTDIYTHNNLEDLPQTIRIPKIGTTASVNDLDETAIYDADGNYIDITITDTVTYENLWTADELASMAEQAKYIVYLDGTVREQENVIYTVSEDAVYMLKGVLMDKGTGEALVNSNGSIYTVYSEPFTPDSPNGTQDVKFDISAGEFLGEDSVSLLAGATLVIYEDLYLAVTKEEAVEEKHVAEHHDINDVEQDIRIPDGRTHAVDGTPGKTLHTEDVIKALNEEHAGESSTAHEAEAQASMTITDLVAYENLHGCTTYTITGTLQTVTAFDSEGKPITWEAARDDDGNVITATAEFTTSGSYDDSVSGTVSLTFTFPGLTLAGKTLVAFERISRDNVTVFAHADITDEAQTIYVPEIGTHASDAENGLSMSLADKNTIILDEVIYENLENGKTYTINAALYNRETGALIDGTEVTGTFMAGKEGQYVIPEGVDDTTLSDDISPTAAVNGCRASGTVVVAIPVDTSILSGKSIVAFEAVLAADTDGNLKEVAMHKNLEDEEQTVQIPLLGTMAAIDGEKSVITSGDVVITDTVSYSNLIAGMTYKVYGSLTDKETGEAVKVTAETEFTAEEPDGTAEMTFTFEASGYEDYRLVAFENLVVVMDDGTEYTVACHEDLEDEYQTVEILAPQVEISKQDITTSEELPGATLIVKDSDGNEIEQWISTDEPHTFRIPVGAYTLTEITAPDGYEVAETIAFEIIDGDVLTSVVMYDTPKGTTTSTGSAPKTGDWFRYAVSIGIVALGILLLVWHKRRFQAR
ncbi:MAG: VaFE repeat-containing surface-anchored protein [Clostridiales bacterium]|nr:VaFE repeat-containing surface-anchored protein [Clostridiales bacterium]